MWAAKQKRRPLTKQEKTDIYRLIDEQKRLGDQLEAMPFPGFNKTICQTKSKPSTLIDGWLTKLVIYLDQKTPSLYE